MLLLPLLLRWPGYLCAQQQALIQALQQRSHILRRRRWQVLRLQLGQAAIKPPVACCRWNGHTGSCCRTAVPAAAGLCQHVEYAGAAAVGPETVASAADLVLMLVELQRLKRI